MKQILLALLLAVTQAHGETIQWSVDGHNPSGELTHVGPKVVVILHGTGGPDSRGRSYAQHLQAQGFSTLIVDYKTGIYSGPHDRNRVRFMPMLAQSIKTLQSKGYSSIGLLGFSLGGTLAVHAKDQFYNLPIRASVALYPVCKNYLAYGRWSHLSDPTTKYNSNPMLIVYGSKDTYGEGKSCPELGNKVSTLWNARFIELEGHHGFDRNEPAMTFTDPDSTHPARIEYNANSHDISTRETVKFFTANL